jgi:tetratricopeptide (TPR) repeat protein
VSLSFWPPIMGKQPEAIQQFEMALAQQEARPSRPEYAQTYLFLGNLYRQQGNAARAKEIWKKGSELFPENDELTRKLGDKE